MPCVAGCGVLCAQFLQLATQFSLVHLPVCACHWRVAEVSIHQAGEAAPLPRQRGALWELRGSSIHKQGMFARKAIAAGTRIIEYLGERVPKAISNERALAWEAQARSSGDGMVYVFDLNDDYDLDGNIPDNPAKYINHSCEENCEAINEDDRIFIYSTRDIAKDEELTFDYGYALEHFLDHPCRCMSKGCVGYIVVKTDRPRLKQLLLKRARRKQAVKPARKED